MRLIASVLSSETSLLPTVQRVTTTEYIVLCLGAGSDQPRKLHYIALPRSASHRERTSAGGSATSQYVDNRVPLRSIVIWARLEHEKEPCCDGLSFAEPASVSADSALSRARARACRPEQLRVPDSNIRQHVAAARSRLHSRIGSFIVLLLHRSLTEVTAAGTRQAGVDSNECLSGGAVPASMPFRSTNHDEIGQKIL